MFWQAINSGDFWHHLNTGKYIFQNHALPYTDNLSFTANGLPWVAHSWGAGVIFYFFYSHFGEIGISFLFLLLGLLTTYFIYLSTNKNLLLALLGGTLISLRWPTRPEVFAPLFCSLLIVLLQRQKFIFLPLLFLVWGIVYGSSVFIGITVLLISYFSTQKNIAQSQKAGFFILKHHNEVMSEYKRKRRSNISIITIIEKATSKLLYSKKIELSLALSVIASLLNGYGLASFLYLKQIPNIAPHVGEWLSVFAALNPQNPNVALFYQFPVLFLIIIIVALILSLYNIRHCESRTRAEAISEAGIAASLLAPRNDNIFYYAISTFALAPFFSIRFLNLYPIFVFPLLAITLNQLPAKLKNKFNLALLLLTIWVIYISFSHPQKNYFPQAAVEFLKENNLNGNILSSQENGAFVSTHLPDSKIFVDTRDDLYQPTQVFQDLSKLNINELVNKYPVNIVIADINEYYHPLLYNPRWHLAFLSDQYFVLTTLAVKSELKSIDPLQVPPAKKRFEKEALTETVQNSPENIVRQIQLLLSLNRQKEAVDLLTKLNLQNRLEDNELQNLVYLLAGDCEKADVYFKKSVKQTKHQFIFTPWVNLPTIARPCP